MSPSLKFHRFHFGIRTLANFDDFEAFLVLQNLYTLTKAYAKFAYALYGNYMHCGPGRAGPRFFNYAAGRAGPGRGKKSAGRAEIWRPAINTNETFPKVHVSPI